MKISTACINAYLAESGLTSTAFAAKAGIARQNFSTIKTRGTCSPQNAGKIARAMGIDVKELLLEEAS